MSIQSLKNEIKALKKEIAPGFKTIEELSKCDIRTLTDDELFRLAFGDRFDIKSLAELTDEDLELLIKEELDKFNKEHGTSYTDANEVPSEYFYQELNR